MVNQLGRTVFTGLIKVEDDGQLLVMIPMADSTEVSDDEPSWLAETLGCAEARSLAVQLEVAGAGGGTA
jgi:hypothetical protein